MKLGRNFSITIVCIILGIIIAWQYQSISYSKNKADLEKKNAEQLKDDIINQQRTIQNLQKRNDELTKTVEKYEKDSGQVDTITKNLKDELDRAKTIAGLTDVKGKGVVITLDNNDTDVVREDDLLNLVNELKASDAQAISVNNERIVATSEIRYASGYIMINGKQNAAPFTVKVIGNPQNIMSALNLPGGPISELKTFLKFSATEQDEVVIPKARDDGSVIKTDLLKPVR